MIYSALADIVGTVHAAFVLFVVGGQVLICVGWAAGWRWTRAPLFRWTHLAAILFVVVDTWLGKLCPLTILENDLRQLARQEGVGNSFIAYWLERLLYYRAPSWVFLVVYTAFGTLVAATFVLYPPRPKQMRGRDMEKRKNGDVLVENLSLKGKKVVDVGCGDGGLVRLMTRHGANAVGIECSQGQLKAARAEPAIANEIYVEGVAEDLPFDEDSLDAVVFFNSLHHVAVESQSKALEEAHRVLKAGGTLYIAEPLAQGPNFEVGRAVDDETEIRAKAYEAIKDASTGAIGLKAEKELTYIHTIESASFEAFRDRHIRVDPARAAVFERDEAKLRELFHKLGKPSANGFAFDQPIRVNILIKT